MARGGNVAPPARQFASRRRGARAICRARPREYRAPPGRGDPAAAAHAIELIGASRQGKTAYSRRQRIREVGMGLAVAIQMDPVDTINIDADSTFALALEAQARGHALYHYLPQALTLRDGRLRARGRPLEVFRRHGHHHRFGNFEELDLAGVDVILMRQDPPFDMAYITATHLLELLPRDGPLVVNDPASVRNAPEKLFVLRFKELMPPTLLSLDPAEIREFWRQHGDIILKPLFGNGGAGVMHLRPGDDNLGSLLEMYASVYREPVMVQRYLPEVRQGDKRIILVEGEPDD